MDYDLQEDLKNLQTRICDIEQKIDLENIKARISKLTETRDKAGFWDNPKENQKILKELSQNERLLAEFSDISDSFSVINELAKILSAEDTEGSYFTKDFLVLKSKIEAFEFNVLLSGEFDDSDCYFSLHSGTGGVDAMDFTDMLLRMYLRFFERQGYKIEILDKQVGDEAGIKSVMLEVKGDYAYGYLKAEKGVHRLVRKSPFNSKGLRQTSFALVEVMPKVDEVSAIEIDPSEVRVDTFRASGAGGQHVNTTDSAVRITHLKTGIVTQCQNERSQLQNKEQALSILKAKLRLLMVENQKAKVQDVSGESLEASWGNQIRSYVLHPYTLVKDHRTDYEDADTKKILDGDLMDFIKAWLKRK
jgi:peptide chain release factor 2